MFILQEENLHVNDLASLWTRADRRNRITAQRKLRNERAEYFRKNGQQHSKKKKSGCGGGNSPVGKVVCRIYQSGVYCLPHFNKMSIFWFTPENILCVEVNARSLESLALSADFNHLVSELPWKPLDVHVESRIYFPATSEADALFTELPRTISQHLLPAKTFKSGQL